MHGGAPPALQATPFQHRASTWQAEGHTSTDAGEAPDEQQASLTQGALAVAQGVAALARGARGGGASRTRGTVGCRAGCG